VVAVGIKHLWFMIENKKAIGQEILRLFFSDSNDLQSIKNGLLLNSLIVQNLLINNSSYGYFKFRNMINKFMDEILIDLFDATKRIILGVFDLMNSQQAGPECGKLLELSLKFFNQTITYPFCLSYSEFSSEINLEEIQTAFVPDNWEHLIIDLNLYEKMLIFCSSPSVPMQVRFLVLKIFSRICSVKPTMIKDDQKQIEFIKYMLSVPNRILPNLNLNNKGALEDFLDLFLRFIYVMGLRRLVQFGGEFENWMNCFLTILSQVFSNYSQLEDRVYSTVNQLFKKFSFHYSSMEYNFGEKLMQSFNLYMNVNFNPSSNINIFKETSFNKYDKLVKMIDGRFEYFKEFYSNHKEPVFSVLNNVMDQCIHELNVTSNLPRVSKPRSMRTKDSPRIRSTWSSRGSATSWSSSLSRFDQETTTGLNHSDLEGILLAKCFACISNLSIFTQHVSVGLHHPAKHAEEHGVLSALLLGENLGLRIRRPELFGGRKP